MITLKETCGACPEQYDAYLDDRIVGYLRLRHGAFSVQCPDVGGECVYRAYTNGDGMFESEEREAHLEKAKFHISKWLKEQK